MASLLVHLILSASKPIGGQALLACVLQVILHQQSVPRFTEPHFLSSQREANFYRALCRLVLPSKR